MAGARTPPRRLPAESPGPRVGGRRSPSELFTEAVEFVDNVRVDSGRRYVGRCRSAPGSQQQRECNCSEHDGHYGADPYAERDAALGWLGQNAVPVTGDELVEDLLVGRPGAEPGSDHRAHVVGQT